MTIPGEASWVGSASRQAELDGFPAVYAMCAGQRTGLSLARDGIDGKILD